jgi:DNA-directed RNA polymerase II subunit RPB1
MSKSSGLNKTLSTSKIVGIQFSILSPEEIRNGSVAEITSKDAYVQNKPIIGGLFDPRMGVLDQGFYCPTDGLDYMTTPGYFGHIELAKPVFYIQYMSTIQKILRCVCFKCSKLLISKKKYKQALSMMPSLRWKYVNDICKKIKRCGDDTDDGCGCLQPTKIKKEGIASIVAEWKEKTKKRKVETNEEEDAEEGEGDDAGEDDAGEETGNAASDDEESIKDEIDEMIPAISVNSNNSKIISINLTPELVLKIFKRISDEDVSFLGFSPIFSRPDWMICQVLAVPPPAVRPSVKHDAQQQSHDDLTHILVNIIKANKTLLDKIQSGNEASIKDWTVMLQYHVASMVDNKIQGAGPATQRSGRPYKSIKERLNGKHGRMRANLMAKRVDFSSRSVITADPNISIRELGVPLKIAKNQTKPVKVNKMNRGFLTKLVQNGPDIWPGAKILDRRDGTSVSLKYADRKMITLNEGDIVHRHLMDGDPVLFNRQPTLHRMSMMCHIARIMMQGDTFRMNVADTKPYNADFDKTLSKT